MSTVSVASATQLQAALKTAKGGDTILLAAGNYGDVLISSIRYDSAVTLRSADTARPATFASLKFSGAGNISLDHVQVQLVPTSVTMSWSAGVEVLNSSNIAISNSRLVGGLAVNGVPASATDLDSTGNVIGMPVARGVSVRNSSGFTIVNSDISTFFKGIVLDNTVGVTISGNDIHGLRGSPVTGSDVSNVTVSSNHMHDSNPWRYLTGGDHGDFVHFWTNPSTQTTASTNISVTGNFLDQGMGAPLVGIYMDDNGNGLGFTNVKISDNVIFNSDGQGVRLENTHGATITNNSFLQSRSTGTPPGVVLTDGTDGLTFTRNILTGPAAATLAAAADGNVYLQRTDTGAANYYGKVFINPLTIGAAQTDLEINPSSTLSGKGYGSSLSAYASASATSEAIFTTVANATDHRTISFDASLSHVAGGSTANGSSASSYRWNFGDGTTGAGTTLNHNYARAGNYSVTLTMTDPFGNVSASRHDLAVTDEYLLHLDFSPTGIADTSSYGSGLTGATAISNLVETSRGTTYHLAGANWFEAPEQSAGQIFNRNQFTLSFSLQRDSATIGTGSVMRVHNSWSVSLTSKGEIQFDFKNQAGTAYKVVGTGIKITDTNAHDVDLAFDSTRSIATIYVDGKAAGSGTVSGATQMMANWGFAVGNPYGTSALAKIGDISFIDHAESAADIATAHTAATMTASSASLLKSTTTITASAVKTSPPKITAAPSSTRIAVAAPTSFSTPSLGSVLMPSSTASAKPADAFATVVPVSAASIGILISKSLPSFIGMLSLPHP